MEGDMIFLCLIVILSVLLFLSCLIPGAGKRTLSERRQKNAALILFFSATLLRLICAAASKGFDNDTACFAAWADRIFQVGFRSFYSPDVFSDYPPGYLYLLYPIGAVRNLFHIGYYSPLHLILLKLPAIFCDLACGAVIFFESRKRFQGDGPLLLCAVYLFNPAVILNTSVWGQVDSVYTLLLLLMCLSMIRNRLPVSYLCFAVGLLIKPQTLLFAPVLFAGFLDRVILHHFSVRKLMQHLAAGLSCILLAFLLILPFGVGNVLRQYVGTVASYPYATVNAYNFWGLLGKNWISQDTVFLGISYRFLGYLAIVIAVVSVLAVSIRAKRDRQKYPLLCALLMSSIFLFSVRMHERYLYPAVILLLLAIVFRPTRKLYLCYAGFSILHFINTADVLFFYELGTFDATKPIILLVSAGMLFCFGLLLSAASEYFHSKDGAGLRLLFTDEFRGLKALAAQVQKAFLSPKEPLAVRPSGKLTRLDFCILLCITVLYSVLAFRDLGDRVVPETEYPISQTEALYFDFNMQTDSLPTELTGYIALPHRAAFDLYAKASPEEPWCPMGTITFSNVFTWQTVSLPSMEIFRERSERGEIERLHLRLEPTADISILEFSFRDSNGFPVEAYYLEDYSALFDEQELIPARATFRNGMYFDEIYHARTAYEFLLGEESYENTHPPLGKFFISLGIRIFGMNPFGWRFMGTLFGILMVPLTYLFGKALTRRTSLATLCCILYTFDFMHFTQSRLATIDVYIAFFVMAMYYFMWRYLCTDFYDDQASGLRFLLLCGISMGLGVACKWTGVYAGMGLAVIFFGALLYRYREYAYTLVHKPAPPQKRLYHRMQKYFKPNALRTIVFCILFFVLIPCLIYLFSYLPFRDGTDNGLFARMLQNQKDMFSYHSSLNATHPYSSSWYEWPIIKRPIWYYSGIVTGSWGTGGIREGISAFGNPLVWWAGIPAFLYAAYLAIRKKDKTAAFLVIGYLAQYLPWMFVGRVTFIYHYFPSVIFVVLMIVYSLSKLQKKVNTRLYLLLLGTYAAAVIVLFAVFYPVLSGQPVDAEFVLRYLRWFPSWVLTAG